MIAKLTRSSPQRNDNWLGVIEDTEQRQKRLATSGSQSNDEKSPQVLILDVPTRLNSLFFMIKHALRFRKICVFYYSFSQLTYLLVSFLLVCPLRLSRIRCPTTQSRSPSMLFVPHLSFAYIQRMHSQTRSGIPLPSSQSHLRYVWN